METRPPKAPDPNRCINLHIPIPIHALNCQFPDLTFLFGFSEVNLSDEAISFRGGGERILVWGLACSPTPVICVPLDLFLEWGWNYGNFIPIPCVMNLDVPRLGWLVSLTQEASCSTRFFPLPGFSLLFKLLEGDHGILGEGGEVGFSWEVGGSGVGALVGIRVRNVWHKRVKECFKASRRCLRFRVFR